MFATAEPDMVPMQLAHMMPSKMEQLDTFDQAKMVHILHQVLKIGNPFAVATELSVSLASKIHEWGWL